MKKVEQHWKVQVVKDNPTYPFIVIDNWYTPQEEKNIWKELDWYSSHEQIDRAEDTIVARYSDGTSMSKAYRFYTGDYYSDIGYNKSHVANYMYKQRTPEFHKIIGECMPYARSFMTSNKDSTLISYYEEDDHYDPHHDTFLWTCLIWMVREPRLFTGGDFDFPESGYEVKLKNNRAVFFPCCYLHRVSPVKFHTQPKETGYGRYTITHFYFSGPKPVGSKT
jgi:hypothetical protein